MRPTQNKNRKKITRTSEDFVTVWTNSDNKGDIDVAVKKDGVVILEWVYPKIPGHGGLAGQSLLWLPQIIVEVQDMLKQKGDTENG